jgi:hypothetical protein
MGYFEKLFNRVILLHSEVSYVDQINIGSSSPNVSFLSNRFFLFVMS